MWEWNGRTLTRAQQSSFSFIFTESLTSVSHLKRKQHLLSLFKEESLRSASVKLPRAKGWRSIFSPVWDALKTAHLSSSPGATSGKRSIFMIFKYCLLQSKGTISNRFCIVLPNPKCKNYYKNNIIQHDPFWFICYKFHQFLMCLSSKRLSPNIITLNHAWCHLSRTVKLNKAYHIINSSPVISPLYELNEGVRADTESEKGLCNPGISILFGGNFVAGWAAKQEDKSVTLNVLEHLKLLKLNLKFYPFFNIMIRFLRGSVFMPVSFISFFLTHFVKHLSMWILDKHSHRALIPYQEDW